MVRDSKGKGKEMTGDGEVLSRQGLKSALWYTVVKIIEEEEITLGVTTSEVFVASIAELVFAQTISLGKDLEAFAKHAGRTTIGVEDVKLATRRNPALYELISTEATKHGLSIAALRTKATKGVKRAPPKKAPAKATKAKATHIDIDDDDDDEYVAPRAAREDDDEEMDDVVLQVAKPKATKKPRAKKAAAKEKERDD